MSDPIETYYRKGYSDASAGKRRSPAVPQNFKLAYSSGRYDAASGKLNRYDV